MARPAVACVRAGGPGRERCRAAPAPAQARYAHIRVVDCAARRRRPGRFAALTGALLAPTGRLCLPNCAASALTPACDYLRGSQLEERRGPPEDLHRQCDPAVTGGGQARDAVTGRVGRDHWPRLMLQSDGHRAQRHRAGAEGQRDDDRGDHPVVAQPQPVSVPWRSRHETSRSRAHTCPVAGKPALSHPVSVVARRVSHIRPTFKIE